MRRFDGLESRDLPNGLGAINLGFAAGASVAAPIPGEVSTSPGLTTSGSVVTTAGAAHVASSEPLRLTSMIATTSGSVSGGSIELIGGSSASQSPAPMPPTFAAAGGLDTLEGGSQHGSRSSSAPRPRSDGGAGGVVRGSLNGGGAVRAPGASAPASAASVLSATSSTGAGANGGASTFVATAIPGPTGMQTSNPQSSTAPGTNLIVFPVGTGTQGGGSPPPPVVVTNPIPIIPPSQPVQPIGGVTVLPGDGVLRQTSASTSTGDIAVLTDQAYPSNVEVTAKVRVDTWTGGPSAVAGVGLGLDPTSGKGYELVFHDGQNVEFLDNGTTLGNAYPFTWTQGEWYWFKLARINNTLYGEIWQDGQAQPSTWQFVQTGWNDHNAGAPGLVGGASSGSSTSTASFDSLSVTQVSATDAGGAALPPGPSGSIATVKSAGAGALNISWTPVSGASGYIVERSSSASGPFVTVTETSGAASVVANTGLAPSGVYYYKVLSQFPNGTEQTSSTAVGTAASSTSTPSVFSDNFDNQTLASSWYFSGGDWAAVNGTLSQTAPSSAASPLDQAILNGLPTNQTYALTAKVRVDSATGGLATGGQTNVGIALDAVGTNPGVELTFNSAGVGFVGGSTAPFSWNAGTWYWMKEQEYQGVEYGKVWADGTPEPATWMVYDRQPLSSGEGMPELLGGYSSSAGAASGSFDEVSVATTPTPTINKTSAVAAGPGTVTVSWTAAPSADQYVLERETSSSGAWTIVSMTAEGSGALLLQDGGLPAGATFTYRVLDELSGTILGASAPATVTTSSAPSPGNPIVSESFNNGGELNGNWSFTFPGWWDIQNGVMTQRDPELVLQSVGVLSAPYLPSNAEITAKVQVTALASPGSPANVGVGVNADPVAGLGYSLVFTSPGHVAFYDGTSSVGNVYNFNWTTGRWYWFSLVDQGGTLYGKIWQDGAQQPSAWQFIQKGWSDHTAGGPALVAGFSSAPASPAEAAFDNVLITTTSPVASPPASTTTPGPSATANPSVIAASAISDVPGAITLSWTAVPNASDYIIERATSASGPFIEIGDAPGSTAFQDSVLPAGSTYYYKIFVSMPYGSSFTSSIVSATTAQPSVGVVATDAFLGSTLGANWVAEGGTWSESGGVLRQTTIAAHSYNLNALVDESPSAMGANVVQAKVRFNTLSFPYGTLGVGLDTYMPLLSGYRLSLTPNGALHIGDIFSVDSPSASFPVQAGTWYWLKLEQAGGVLEGKAWADGQAEPSGWQIVWDTSFNQSELVPPGPPAIYGAFNPNTPPSPNYFGIADFSASYVPTLSQALTASTGQLLASGGIPGVINLSWSQAPGAAGFLVQRSSDGGATWTTIADITGDQTQYADSGLTPNTSFMYRTLVEPAQGEAVVFAGPVSAMTSSQQSGWPMYSDSFSGSTLSPVWSVTSASTGAVWAVSTGSVSVTESTDTPTALVASRIPFGSTPEITAEVRVNTWSSFTDSYAGLGLQVDPTTGAGFGFVLSGPNTVSFIGSTFGPGNSFAFDWSPGVWYSMALKINNGTLYGKVWGANQPEPTDWPFVEQGWGALYASGAPALLAQLGQYDTSQVPLASFKDAAIYSMDPTQLNTAATNLAASAVQPGAIMLNWSGPSNATGFIIQRSANGGASWAQISDANAGTGLLEDTGLIPGANYEYRIAALTLQGETAFSSVVTATTAYTPVEPVLFETGFEGGTVPPQLTLLSGSWTAMGLTTSTATTDLGGGRFSFTLGAPAVTSAGVYTSSGALVQTLWTMQSLDEGVHTGYWDGYNQIGGLAPAGTYSIQVTINGSTYANVGSIGNSGLPADYSGHTPVAMTGIAISPSGAIYTADNYDESGVTIKQWTSSGSTAANLSTDVMPSTIATDGASVYAAGVLVSGAIVIERLTPGGILLPFPSGPGITEGEIQVYAALAPAASGASSSQIANILSHPLVAMTVSGNSLWVVDAAGNRVLDYDKNTGRLLSQFSVPFPTALAVDASGQVWVGYNQVDVGVFSPSGTLKENYISNLGFVTALAFAPSGELFVADSSAGSIEAFNVAQGMRTPVEKFGKPATQGDSNPADLYWIRSMAIDASGDIYIAQGLTGGDELTKFNPAGALIWNQFGLEFVSSAAIDPANPSTLYTDASHAYLLGSGSSLGQSQFLGVTTPAYSPIATRGYTGQATVDSIGGSSFFFESSRNEIDVFRINGATMTPVAAVGAADMPPGGMSVEQTPFWTWTSPTATGTFSPSQVQFFSTSGLSSQILNPWSFTIDSKGDIWWADHLDGTVYELPIAGLNAAGNPAYNWNAYHMVIGPDTSGLGFKPAMVSVATDGTIYALGNAASIPGSPGIAWMGGNEVARYSSSGQVQWMSILPETVVSVAAINGGGGGLIAGGMVGSMLYHYASNGLLIGTIAPGVPMDQTAGWFDNNGAITATRNPTTGAIEVFTEDVYDLRMGWYQINDTQIVTMSGSEKRP